MPQRRQERARTRVRIPKERRGAPCPKLAPPSCHRSNITMSQRFSAVTAHLPAERPPSLLAPEKGGSAETLTPTSTVGERLIKRYHGSIRHRSPETIRFLESDSRTSSRSVAAGGRGRFVSGAHRLDRHPPALARPLATNSRSTFFAPP